MEAIFEGLLFALCELVFTIFGEVLAELGFHALAAPFRRRAHPVLAGFGYALLGAAVGGVSVLILPAHLIRDPTLDLTYLVLSPVLAGLVMTGVGALRARRGQALVRLDSFGYGYVFALAFAVVRWQLAA